jgi:ATP-dependent 26S proteasome regulatory subunit
MMTAEQKRERLLKRMLPALAITVIYFVFLSHIMVEQKTKAEESFNQLNMQGISTDALPGIYRQTEQFKSLNADLDRKKTEQQKQIDKIAAFAAASKSATESATQVATILSRHQVRVIQDEHVVVENKALSRSLQDIKKLLLPNETVQVQHLELQANYLSMYGALKEIVDSKIQVMPVSFSMRSPLTSANSQPGEMIWVLELWI